MCVLYRSTQSARGVGPASEAQTLYTDLSPPQPRDFGKPFAERGGRPSKAERRIGEQIKRGTLE